MQKYNIRSQKGTEMKSMTVVGERACVSEDADRTGKDTRHSVC